MNFLQGLGAYVRLKDIHGVSVYSGGLDTKYGEDGDFSIAWHDDVMQVNWDATEYEGSFLCVNWLRAKRHANVNCIWDKHEFSINNSISTIKSINEP